MSNSQETIQGLAAQISELSGTFTKFLEENKIKEPTFAADSVTSYEGLTIEMFQTRQLLLDKLNDLSILVSGPSESVFNYAHAVSQVPRSVCG